MKIYYTLYTIKLKICTQRFYYSSSKFSKIIHAFTVTRSVHRTDSSMRSVSLCGTLEAPVQKVKAMALTHFLLYICHQIRSSLLSGVSLLAVSNVNNPVGLVGLPYVMWSAHVFVTHIQMEKISCWNGPTVHVCCFMLACASTKTFVSRVQKTAKKIFVSRKIRQQGHSLAEVSLCTVVVSDLFISI